MDLYVILGLERTASLGEIKRAYRRLARRYHPDINPGDRTAAAHFERISEAYETLSDPDRRRHYDVGGRPAEAVESGTLGFQGFDFSVSVSGAPAPTFGELFGDVLRPRRGRREARVPERGADLHQTMSLGFEEAVRGGLKEITITRLDRCLTCRGLGTVSAGEGQCRICRGTGSITSARGYMVFSSPCTACEGTGRVAAARCPTCHGQHGLMRTELVAVRLPAGLSDGAQIRVPGKGHCGPGGGEYGDLFVSVRVEPHPIFRREGDDLHISVPVAIHEAGLGARIDVPSLDGPASVRIPPGTHSGQRFHVRGRGAPSARAGTRGDLIVEVRLVFPEVLGERSKELLREFGHINTGDVRKELSGWF